MTLILASTSPRRAELLSRLQVQYRVVPSGVEEREPKIGEEPAAYALALAREKVEAVASRYPDDVVLAADTVVAVDSHILGKPADQSDALRMLSLLCGRVHVVVTGVVVACGGRRESGASSARVRMRSATDEELRAYIATGEPMDKAGAYAVQGRGGRFVDNVTGCYNAVVGLPLRLSTDLLGRCGIEFPTTGCCTSCNRVS
jgi:septum formation protein